MDNEICDVPLGTIYIYDGPGASDNAVLQAFNSIEEAMHGRYLLQYISYTKIEVGEWTKDAVLLVMPGGADVPYAEYLKGKGNQVITEYVASGGAYLGICAGSYYASADVEFDKGGKLQVLGARELAFFNNTAIGPILAPYDYGSCSGCQAVSLNWSGEGYHQFKNVKIFYNGGGYFLDAHSFSNVEVLASYKIDGSKPLPAVIKIIYGLGTVLLSGVHFEYNYKYFDLYDKELQAIGNQLKIYGEERKRLMEKLLADHISTKYTN